VNFITFFHRRSKDAEFLWRELRRVVLIDFGSQMKLRIPQLDKQTFSLLDEFSAARDITETANGTYSRNICELSIFVAFRKSSAAMLISNFYAR